MMHHYYLATIPTNESNARPRFALACMMSALLSQLDQKLATLGTSCLALQYLFNTT